MRSRSFTKLKKNRWPLFAAIASAAGLICFQNCSNVQFGNAPNMLQAASIPDTPDEPAHFPPQDPPPPLCTQISQNIQPTLNWDWYSQLGANDFHSFNQVMAAPVVGDLDGNGKPEVVFVSWSNNLADPFNHDATIANYNKNGVLRVVNGHTGATKFSVGSQALAPFASTTPLLVDLDGDGTIEIVYMHYLEQKVIALNSDGSLRWTWTLPKPMNSDCMQGLSTSDVDENGHAEVIVGDWILEENAQKQPVLKMTLNSNPTYITCSSFASVLDPSNPHFSILEMDAVYDHTGAKQFSLGSEYGYLAVGKVRNDIPGNQIVKTAYNGSGGAQLQIYDGIHGTLLKSVDLLALSQYKCPSGSIGGGPASIGDFMGNGSFQIAIATGQYLMLFDGNGNLLTSSRTQDCSSEETGVTAFDFDGDGKPEIIYGDEQYLRIFHVVNGQLTVVAKLPNPSGTLLEYPVVADIDGDGSSKLIVISNNYAVSSFYQGPGEAADGVAAAGITGVRTFKSGDGLPWMPSRQMWNQYHYNASLVNDRGRVYDPAVSSQSWLGKTFKLNSQITLSQPICRH